MNSMKRYKKVVLRPLEWILALQLIPLLLLICALISAATMLALWIATISLIGMKLIKQDNNQQNFLR